MKIVFQMDPLEKLTSRTDSTIALIKAALHKNDIVYYYIRSDLFLEGSKVFARLNKLSLDQNNKLCAICEGYGDLSRFDCLLVRDEPPFDMSYITSTYILDYLKDQVLIINDPAALRNFPEKLSSMHYYQYMVPTCVSSDLRKLNDFLSENGQVVIKPLYSFGGKDVEVVESKADLIKLYSKLSEKYSSLPVMLQKYIPEVSLGDKRVFIFNGKIKGVVNRVPKKGEIVANLVAGGQAEKSGLSDAEYNLSNKLAKDLKSKKILIAGIDLINGYLSEINITCPTGIVNINELEGYKGQELIENQIISEIKSIL